MSRRLTASFMDNLANFKKADLQKIQTRVSQLIEQKSQDTTTLRLCTDIWDVFYDDRKQVKFVYDGQQIKALKRILKKTRDLLVRNGTKDPEPELVVRAFTKLLTKIEPGSWIMENLSLSLVDSKFNQLVATASKEVQQQDATAKFFESHD